MSDLELAEAVVVADAVSPPWTQCCPPNVFDAASLATHVCGTTESLPAARAGFERQFARGLDAAGRESAHLIIAAKVEPTASIAASELAAVAYSGYQPCMIGDINSAVLTTYGSATPSPATTVTRLGRSILGTGIHDRYVTRMTAGSQVQVTYTDIVRVLVGRVLLRFGMTSYGTASPAPMLDNVVRSTADRALRAQSTG